MLGFNCIYSGDVQTEIEIEQIAAICCFESSGSSYLMIYHFRNSDLRTKGL